MIYLICTVVPCYIVDHIYILHFNHAVNCILHECPIFNFEGDLIRCNCQLVIIWRIKSKNIPIFFFKLTKKKKLRLKLEFLNNTNCPQNQFFFCNSKMNNCFRVCVTNSMTRYTRLLLYSRAMSREKKKIQVIVTTVIIIKHKNMNILLYHTIVCSVFYSFWWFFF